MISSPLVGSQRPRFRTVPDGATDSWGREAVDLMASVGVTMDAGQEDIITDGMSRTGSGLWVASEVADIEPRQNGKTLVLEARALAGAYLLKEPLIVWTAHEFKTATQAFRSMRDRVTNYDHLRKRVRSIRDSGARTEIELFNPMRMITFLARSGGSGRGFAQVAPLFLDEAYALSREQVAALVFAMSAARNPQVWYMSSAPLKDSEVLRDIARRGRRGSRTLVYYEWSATGSERDLLKLVADNKDADPDTEHGQRVREQLHEKVAEANRAFRTRISDTTIERELAAAGPEQFVRERLGGWSELEAGGKLDPERWNALGDPDSRRSGDVAIAVDISIERDWAAIGMYGERDDGQGHLQLIDYRPGTDWVIGALKQLRDALSPLAIGMARGTWGSLREDLKAAGFMRPEDRPMVEAKWGGERHPPARGDLCVMTGPDMAAACGHLIDAVRQGTMRHVPVDQLNRAVQVARTRVVGDVMTWVRNDSTVDVTGLTAVTEARWTFYARQEMEGDYDPSEDLF